MTCAYCKNIDACVICGKGITASAFEPNSKEELAAADEQINQLSRALREAVEPPTFMGEPMPHPANRAAQMFMDPQRRRELGLPDGVLDAAPEVTDAMVDAYLQANDAYWKRTDELPVPPDRWRTGTPREATRESLRAALGVSASADQPPAQDRDDGKEVDRG